MKQKRYKLYIFFWPKGQLFQEFASKVEAEKYRSCLDDTVEYAFLQDRVTDYKEWWKTHFKK